MDSSGGTTISWATSAPALLREHHLADAIRQEGPPAPDVRESELDAEGDFRGGLLFMPPEPTPGVGIVYFHGGGFLAGSPRTHRSVASWLAHFAGMPVLAARYRLTPEHTFPAQRDDAVAACAKAFSLFREDGGFRLFLSGDSAGACVSLWGLLGLPERLRTAVAGLVLFYGGFGLTESASIARAGTPDNGLDTAALRSMYGRLLDGESFTQVEQISPLGMIAAVRTPTYIVAAAEDAVFDDSVALFNGLRQHGTPATLVVAPGMDHGYLKQTGRLEIANQSIRAAAGWMGTLL